MSENRVVRKYELSQLGSGQYILNRADGLPVSDTERDMLLEATRLAWRLQGDAALELEANDLIGQAIWTFPRKCSEMFKRSGGVYFAHSNALREIKIGSTSKSLLGRVTQIRGIEHVPDLELIAAAQIGWFYRLEIGIHQLLRKSRTHGEWFAEAPVLEFLAQIKAGTL